MYNKNYKTEYLKSLCLNDTAYQNYYNMLAKYSKYEDYYGKDLSEFDFDEMNQTFMAQINTNISTATIEKSRIKMYIDWCIVNGRTNKTENVAVSINVSQIASGKLKLRFFSSPSDLSNFLELAIHPSKDKNIDIMVGIVAWLRYAGLTELQIYNLRENGVDIGTRKVHVDGRTFDLSEEAISIFELYESSEYLYAYKSLTQQSFCMSDRERYLLLKTGYSFDKFLKSFKVKLNNAKTKYKESTGIMRDFSMGSIWLSGFMYRQYKNELNGEAFNYDEYIEFSSMKSEYTSNRPKDRIASHKRNINNIYNEWKDSLNQ